MTLKRSLSFLLIIVICNSLFAQNQNQGTWVVKHDGSSVERPLDISLRPDGFNIKTGRQVRKNSFIYCHFHLDKPIKSLSFNYKSLGNNSNAQVSLLDAAANEIWSYGGPSEMVSLEEFKTHGQIVFKIAIKGADNPVNQVTHVVSNMEFSYDDEKPVVDEKGFIQIDNITALREYAYHDNVKVRLLPGFYQVDKAYCKQFIEFTGNNSVYDLNGANIMVDTKLFAREDLGPGSNDGRLYAAFGISGNNVTIEGLYAETYGDTPGIQSRNKIFNITGSSVTLKNVEIRTSGSNPWGYGSFYGLGGGDVRKMNGIRVAWPGENIKLIGCKVHMRAMGHAIFVQGAKNTLIEDCHVDGLLRTTDDILAETSGYAFDRDFKAKRGGYIEGATVANDGGYLSGEMFSLSEDGIRIYPQAQKNQNTETGSTTIKNCTVTNMRRGICTGLSSAGDKVINCKVTNCIAAGFNVGNQDTLINCRADAKYAEAVCIPYVKARNAFVDVEILDSRYGMKNKLLVKINGIDHDVKIATSDPSFIPDDMVIKISTNESYGGPWRGGIPSANNITLNNRTNAKVVVLPGSKNLQIDSRGEVLDLSEE